MKKKLSPAQQTLIAAIAGKTLTYRIVSLWRGGVSISSLVDVRIGGEKTEIKVRLSTIEALADKGEVILTDHDNKEYTVVLPALEATEVEAAEAEVPAEVEAQEAHEAQEAEEAQTKPGRNIMAKKISPAQQTLLTAIQGKPLTYRVVRNVGGAGRSISEARIDGKKPDFRIALATIEALVDRGLVIVKSVDKDNMYTVILPCDNHAAAPASHETFEVLKAANDELKSERKEIEKRHRTVGYTVDTDNRLTVIDKERWELYRKAAYVLTTTSPNAIVDAKFAHHVADIAALRSQSPAEKDFWNDQKASWGKEIKQREATEAQVPTADTVAVPARAELLAETEAATRHLIDTSADDKLHRHNLGTVLLAQGKKDSAMQVFLALYESYRKEGNLQEAKQPLWEIILNCPDYAPTAYTLLGKTCEDLQQYPAAIVVYTHASNIGASEDYLYGLHRAYLAMGDSVQAAEYLKQARSLGDEREIAMGRCTPVPAHPEAPEATETATVIWPAGKEMSKHGYAVVRVTGSTEYAAGYVYYKVLDYKSASLVGLYDPTTVCSYRTSSAAIAAAEEFEEIDIDMPRAWRASKIWSARLGLRKSKGVQAGY